MKLKKSLSVITSAFILSSGAVYAVNQHDMSDTINNVSVSSNMFIKYGLPTENIEVTSSGNSIQVVGFVDNMSQYKRLCEVLGDYKSKKVYNNVKVLKSKTHNCDERTTKDLVYKSLYENNLPTDDLIVQVRNNHVLVGGYVNKHINLSNYKKVISNVPGVQNVNNFTLYRS